MAPAVKIHTTPVSIDTLASDAVSSHYGGSPCAPAGFCWPTTPAGNRMHFIGQINMGQALADAPDSIEFPRRGLLQFFYDMRARVWGYGPEDYRHWRFLWYPELCDDRQDEVADGPSCPRRPRLMSFEPVYTVPDPGSLKATVMAYGERVSGLEYQTYELWAETFENAHQVGGCPWLIHGHVFAVAQLASHGIDLYSHDDSYQSDPHALDLLCRRDEWTLLWQISSDEDLGYCWGAAGTVYVMVRRQDLLRGDLSRPWLVIEFF